MVWGVSVNLLKQQANSFSINHYLSLGNCDPVDRNGDRLKNLQGDRRSFKPGLFWGYSNACQCLLVSKVEIQE